MTPTLSDAREKIRAAELEISRILAGIVDDLSPADFDVAIEKATLTGSDGTRRTIFRKVRITVAL